MNVRSAIAIAGYGLLATVALACLWLISLAPLRLNWGRELVGAAIAVVAMAVGLQLARRRAPRSERLRIDPPAPAHAGEPPPAAMPAADAGAPLSARELQVLRLLANGLSNKQLAREMAVSENTIKTHLANVYGKLGVRKRTEAMAAAHTLGLLTRG